MKKPKKLKRKKLTPKNQSVDERLRQAIDEVSKSTTVNEKLSNLELPIMKLESRGYQELAQFERFQKMIADTNQQLEPLYRMRNQLVAEKQQKAKQQKDKLEQSTKEKSKK